MKITFVCVLCVIINIPVYPDDIRCSTLTLCLSYSLEIGSPIALKLGWWPASPSDPYVSVPTAVGVQEHISEAMPSFYVGARIQMHDVKLSRQVPYLHGAISQILKSIFKAQEQMSIGLRA